MEDINKLRKEQRQVHGSVNSQIEYWTRTFVTGLAAFTLTFSGTFIGQTLMKKHIPYKKKTYIVVSSILAAAVSYKVTFQHMRSYEETSVATEGLEDDST